jgi:hypothetical protein
MIICTIRDYRAPYRVQLMQGPNGVHYVLWASVSEPSAEAGVATVRDVVDFQADFNPSEIITLDDFSDYAMMTRGVKLPSGEVANLGLGMNCLKNLYKITMPTRQSLDDYMHVNKHHLMAAVLVPFADSSPDTWVLAVPSRGGVVEYDGPMVSVGSWDECIDNYMPRLQAPAFHDLTDGIVRVVFNIQMPDLQPVALKPWLFFEATAGNLHTSRAQYGDPCILDVSKLEPGTTVRIKAGFKYRPGMADYSFVV